MNKQKNMKKIIFIASFGNFSKLPLGGGQTAARRLLSALKDMGYQVDAIKRHPATAQKKYLRALQFGFWMCIDPIFLFLKLAFRSRKDTITLYMGYMGSILVPLEFMMSCVTRFLKYKNVMYLAGGGTEKTYNQSNKLSQYFQRKILNNYKLVMTEGLENIDFVKRHSNTATFHLPNFTEDGFAPISYPTKPTDKWNIIYFGRISVSKNILMGIEVFNKLCLKYDNIYYTIVGGGKKSYCDLVEKKIQESPYNNKISRQGRLSHEMLKQLMADQHFFLFPSNEPREGHSNALNEAMSYGLVPIVSNNNFLPSIVGNNRLVANQMDVDTFANIIINIIENKDFDSLSYQMYERVKQNFTQEIVAKRINHIIDNL